MDKAEPISIGVEEELFIIAEETGAPAPQVRDRVIAQARMDDRHDGFVVEMMDCQIETNTEVCASIEQLKRAMRRARAALEDAAHTHGARTLATASHPLAGFGSMGMTDQTRYRAALKRHGDVARHACVNALHVHVGLECADARARALGKLAAWDALFIALAASSPYCAGRDTGLDAWRGAALGMRAHTGPAPILDDAAALEKTLKPLHAMGAIESARDLRWDARVNERWSTVELRLCDASPNVDDAAALAALVLVIVHGPARKTRQSADFEGRALATERRWCAMRESTSATLPNADPSRRTSIAGEANAAIKHYAQTARTLDCEEALARIALIAAGGSSAKRQRSAGGPKEALALALEETRRSAGAR